MRKFPAGRRDRRWKFRKVRSMDCIDKSKHISIIVDVDDKNCLAESTVAQQLNHGVRQWLYIIAGVLFPARTERYVRAGLLLFPPLAGQKKVTKKTLSKIPPLRKCILQITGTQPSQHN